VRANDLERLVWSGIEGFVASPGKVLSRLGAALSSRADASKPLRDISKRLDAKQRERDRVIAWARQGRITEGELDAQLPQLRVELSALEGALARAEADRARSESATARLEDAEEFLDELARRIQNLTREEMGAILRRTVPRVKVTPRADGRRAVFVTYRFASPAVIASVPL
jgi:predicted nuclease with TOPRIM domain